MIGSPYASRTPEGVPGRSPTVYYDGLSDLEEYKYMIKMEFVQAKVLDMCTNDDFDRKKVINSLIDIGLKLEKLNICHNDISLNILTDLERCWILDFERSKPLTNLLTDLNDVSHLCNIFMPKDNKFDVSQIKTYSELRSIVNENLT